MTRLRPFWRYFGGKWRAAPLYPAPEYDTIVEPFAGAAGYALFWAGEFWRQPVVLVEKNPIICEVWRFLIATPAADIKALPSVEHVDELPASVGEAARLFVGLCFGAGDTRPRQAVSPMVRRDGGFARLRDRAARQVTKIRHWKIIEGDYTQAPDIEATWFIDPPYQVAGGRATAPKDRGRVRYPHGSDAIDFAALSSWCRTRRGQSIVCENEGADWLPFRTLATTQSARPGGTSREVVWTSHDHDAGTCP